MAQKPTAPVSKFLPRTPAPAAPSRPVAPPPAADNIGNEPVYDMTQPAGEEAHEEVAEVNHETVAVVREAAGMSERDRYLADVARIRAQRQSFGVQTQKLALTPRPGYKRYWFNDAPGRIDLAQANGWSHILDKDKKPLHRVVGTGRDGKAQRAYAMELPDVFWEEDQDKVHAKAQAKMDAIKKRPIQVKPGMTDKSDRGKFYSPDDGGEILKISETLNRS